MSSKNDPSDALTFAEPLFKRFAVSKYLHHEMKTMNYFRSLRAIKRGCPAGKFAFSTASAISGNFLATSSLP